MSTPGDDGDLRSPADAPRKRPRFLTVALAGALLLGAECWTSGYNQLAFYHRDVDPAAELHAGVHDASERSRLEGMYLHFSALSDGASKRAIPVAAATFVLGAALLAFGVRGFAGRRGARATLVQILTVQTAVIVGGHYLLRDVQAAMLDWSVEHTLVLRRQELPPDQLEVAVKTIHVVRDYGAGGWLAFRTAVSALVILALTRPRARAFLDAERAPAPE